MISSIRILDLNSLTSDQIKYLIFPCELQQPSDSETLTRILAHMEQYALITAQDMKVVLCLRPKIQSIF